MREPTVLSTVRFMRELLKEPAGWIKGSLTGHRAPAHNDIDPWSWAQVNALNDGKLSSPNCFCLVGAMEVALGSVSPPPVEEGQCEPAPPLRDRVVRALHRELPVGYTFLAEFNDAPPTTHGDVVLLLDAVVKAQEDAA